MKSFFTAMIVGPSFFIGFIFHMISNGFQFGRDECEKYLTQEADDYFKSCYEKPPQEPQ